jgi:RNA polymerase sigma-70 factor (ECF subfamily)
MPPIRTISPECEANWVIELRNGNVQAFRAIFETYTPELRRFAAITVPRDVAEDIVQEVLFSLWMRREDLALSTDGLTKYLFAAVKKKILQYLRHQRVRDRSNTVVAEVPGATPKEYSPEDELLSDELEQCVQLALAQLSPTQREVVTLRWTQGMAYADIAAILGISQAAAMQQMSRIRRLLQPLLAKFFPEFQ